MKNELRGVANPHTRFAVAVLACAWIVAAGPAPAQRPTHAQNSKNQQERPDADISIVDLQFMDLSTAVDVLRDAGVNVRTAFDPRVQSIILYGPAKQLRLAERLLSELEARNERVAEKVPTIIPVRHRDVESIRNLLARNYGGRGTDIGADEENQSLVVRADEGDLESIRSLVRQFDTPRASLRLQFFFVRGVVGGDDPNDGQPWEPGLPKSLRPVAASLSEAGVSHVTLLAPLIANALEQERFAASGAVMESSGSEVRFEVEGEARIGDDGQTARLELQGQVRRYGIGAKIGEVRSIFSVETSLSVEVGDYVVLAAAPGTLEDTDALGLVVRVNRDDARQ